MQFGNGNGKRHVIEKLLEPLALQSVGEVRRVQQRFNAFGWFLIVVTAHGVLVSQLNEVLVQAGRNGNPTDQT